MSQSDKSIPLLRYSCPPAEGHLLLAVYGGSEHWSLGYSATDQMLYVRAEDWHILETWRNLLINLGAEEGEITNVNVGSVR